MPNKTQSFLVIVPPREKLRYVDLLQAIIARAWELSQADDLQSARRPLEYGYEYTTDLIRKASPIVIEWFANLESGLGTPISRLACVRGRKTPIGRLAFPG